MPNEINDYRSRVGLYYQKALLKTRILYFLDKSVIVQYIILSCMKSSIGITLSVFVHFFVTNFTPNIIYRDITPNMSFNGTQLDYAIFNDSFAKIKIHLLILSGDIETNPGPESKTDLYIMHVNTCSLRSKMCLLEAEYSKFDIITISETWLSESDCSNSILLTNFHPPVRCDRANDPHGGVAIYIRNNLYSKPRTDLHINGLEAVWVETKLDQTSLLVGSFYRPTNSDILYWRLIEESIRRVNDTSQKFLILGDFNTDFSSSPSPYFVNIIDRFQLTQFIDEPTRITDLSSTCLDLIITQSPSIIKSTGVLPAVCSDHKVPYAIIKNTVVRDRPFKRTIFNYNRLDADKLCNLLQQVNWRETLYDTTVDEGAKAFSEIIIEKAKLCMPSKTVTIRPNDVPWMNSEIKLLIEERSRVYRLAKRTNKQEDWLRFRQLRNSAVHAIRQRKLDYYTTLENRITNLSDFGTKEWWKIVNSFLKKKGVDPDEIPPIESNGIVYYANREKAEVFNDYFIAQSVVDNEDDVLPAIPSIHSEITEISLTTSNVKDVILSLNKNKAVGPDLVHNRLLIAALPAILVPLTDMFNRSLEEGIFPKLWKTALVNPVHKKGSKNSCNNYRPISLLSCVGKVLERCVHKCVFNFLSSNNIISQSQSGFIPGDSTVNQLLNIYNDLCSSFDSSVTTQSIYCDISKAFDRVWHKGLLLKLKANGIRGKLHNWFTNYLSSRTQAVVIKGDISNFKRISAGVPQGSVLGPLLFLIYINDIVCNIQSNIKLFADDTSLSLALNNPTERAQILNADLSKIDVWAKQWKVKFNEEKTELVNTCRNNSAILPLTFGNTLLQSSHRHKHLGLVLQSNCKWDEQIKNIVSTVTMLVSCLKSYKYKLNRKALETMYKSFIVPHFDYADIIWDNCTETQSAMLEDLQLEAIRTIIGAVRGTSHQKLYQESGFCTLKERRKRHKLIYYFKMVNGLCPHYLRSLVPDLVSERNPYHRRRPFDRTIPTFHTELYRNSFIPSTTNLWNSLPDCIKTSNSIGQFKKYLRINDVIIPFYHYIGDRKEQIIHCRLRLGISDLKQDMQNRHITDNPFCSCGHARETAEHYLIYCQNYNVVRANTISTLQPIDTQTLLNGNSQLRDEENVHIVKTVHSFISKSNRF